MALEFSVQDLRDHGACAIFQRKFALATHLGMRHEDIVDTDKYRFDVWAACTPDAEDVVWGLGAFVDLTELREEILARVCPPDYDPRAEDADALLYAAASPLTTRYYAMTAARYAVTDMAATTVAHYALMADPSLAAWLRQRCLEIASLDHPSEGLS